MKYPLGRVEDVGFPTQEVPKKSYPNPAVEWAMKVQAVILKTISSQLPWWQITEILGLSCRTMRRWKQRYQQHAYNSLFDRRRRLSPKKLLLATA